jgi:hypothetical protein
MEGSLLLGVALACTWLSGAPSAFALYENTLLRWILFALPWALYLGRADLLRTCGVPSRTHAAVLAGIVGVGAALRCSLAPAPFHAFNWMNDLVGRVAQEPQPAWYGNGFGLFMWPFTLMGLDPEHAMFFGNRVAGLLAPGAIYAATRALTKRPVHALWSALLLAVLPLHARLSASESMQIIPGLFLLLAIVGFRGHAHSGSRSLLLAGILAFTYAALTRADASVVALALPFVYGAKEDRSRLRDPWLVTGIATALALAGPLVVKGAFNHNAVAVSPVVVMRTLSEALALAGPPHVLWALAGAVGFALLIVTGDGWGASVAIAAFVATTSVAGFETNPANRLQLLCAQMPWLLIGTAAVPATLGRGVSGRAVIIGQAAFASIIVVGSARASFFRVVWDQHQEWAFFERAMPVLNQEAPPVIVSPERGELAPGFVPSLPVYRLRADARVRSLSDLLAGRVELPAIYYRSPECFLSHSAAAEDRGRSSGSALRPLCAQVEERFHMEPVITARVDAASYWSSGPLEPVEIGFFRLNKHGAAWDSHTAPP